VFHAVSQLVELDLLVTC